MQRILNLWIILLISASGNQVLGQMNKNQNQARSLGLKVITKVPSICYGENLSIAMELRNKGKGKIVINSENLCSFITFRAYKPSRFGVNSVSVNGFMLTPRMQSHTKDDFVILKPGQVYKKTTEVSLDYQFFKEENDVEFDVTYYEIDQRTISGVSLWTGLITSNRLKLQVKSCISDEKTAPQVIEKH
jgi:hypothetical protein